MFPVVDGEPLRLNALDELGEPGGVAAGPVASTAGSDSAAARGVGANDDDVPADPQRPCGDGLGAVSLGGAFVETGTGALSPILNDDDPGRGGTEFWSSFPRTTRFSLGGALKLAGAIAPNAMG
jgi:hypothetical protein